MHPTTECTENCPGKTICEKRHRKHCKYGNSCYHNRQNLCEFKHDTTNSEHINDKIKNYEQKLKDAMEDKYKEKIKLLEDKIEDLKQVLNKEKERQENMQIETIRKRLHEEAMTNLDKIKDIKVQHKKEIDKLKNKYILEVEIIKDKRTKEENERAEQRQNEIKDLYNKIERIKTEKEIITCENCSQNDNPIIKLEEHIEAKHDQTTYNCKGCNFKTNWMANLKDHRKKCNNNRQRKK